MSWHRDQEWRPTDLGRGVIDRDRRDHQQSEGDVSAEASVQGAGKSKWDQGEEGEIQDKGTLKKVEDKNWTPQGESSGRDRGENSNTKASADQQDCYKCGSKDHKVQQCPKNKAQCDRCGRYGHEASQCYTKMRSDYVAPLCATQVEGQSFFCIPDCPSDINLKERASTAVIKVLSGNVSAKHLEQEFTNILGANVWRWTARKLDDKTFTMRFPNAQMIKSWGHFDLIMKTTPAQISIKPWSAEVGAKGELQTAWFRVKGIPYDKRSVKTLAYVGSLVGVTVEVDDRSLSRIDYVRMKIACRDVSKAPPVAEGAIIPYLYDFSFEREVVIPAQTPSDSVKIPASSNPQPSPKKPRLELGGTGKNIDVGNIAGGSAPAKLNQRSAEGRGHSAAMNDKQVQPKLMADAMKKHSQKQLWKHKEKEGGNAGYFLECK